MPVPFILDSIHLMPSLQCQVLNAKFIQFVTAFKVPRMYTLLLIEGLLCPPVLPSSLLPFAIGKTLLFSATSSELPLKCMHASACGSCWFSWVFREGNEPKFRGDFGENNKMFKGYFMNGFSQFRDQMFICCVNIGNVCSLDQIRTYLHN